MGHGLMSSLRGLRFARPLAFLLSVSIYWVSATAARANHLADPIADAAAHGQNAGQAFVPSPDIATAYGQGNFTLYPNSATPLSIPAGEMFPGASGDFSAYTGTYGNDAAMQSLGTDAQAVLETQQSYPGEGYLTREAETGMDEATAIEEAKRCYLCNLRYQIDVDRCIFCRACIEVAPRNCIKLVKGVEMADDGGCSQLIETREWNQVGAIWIDNRECIRCGACVAACPVHCISISRCELVDVDV